MIALTDIAYAIKLAIDADIHIEYPRFYLGMSQLGHKCPRYLWFYFHWAEKIKYKAKNKRIFSRGDLEENRVFSYWKNIGIKVLAEQRTLTAFDGHLRGHTDGIVTNIPGLEDEEVVGEIKTMAHKYFIPLTKKGVKEAKPEYYAQAQVYLHFENKKYCLHSTTNKNDEELHIELIPYNAEFAEPLVAKAHDIIKAHIPPPKISTDPTYFMCQWCDFYNTCQLNEPFMKSCRTCQFSSPAINSKWQCTAKGELLTIDEQKAACPKYDMLKI